MKHEGWEVVRSGNDDEVVKSLRTRLATIEAKVWREAAQRCHDVPRSHLPDYFNSIAEEVERNHSKES
jgi:hypothetical protein